MKPRIILVLLLLLSSTVAAFATPQIPDILIYDGKEYPIILHSFLNNYFKRFPERDPKPLEDGSCSALGRGYRATFEVSNEKIYLKDVHINLCSGPLTSVLKTVVPDGKQLYVDWVTDLVNTGYGENNENAYSIEFFDAFEHYTFFQIDKGKVLEVRHFDNKGYLLFKKKQFKAYKKTKEYDLDVKKMLERDTKMTKSNADKNIELLIFFSSTIKTFLVK